MIIEKKTVKTVEIDLIKDLSEKCDLLYETVRILIDRGFDTVEKINSFIHPSKDQFLNPFGLKGMSEAISRLEEAKKNNEKVLVYGDYDADGICSTTIMYNIITEFGLECMVVVPERDDGYGLTQKVIDQAVENFLPDLLITVDCGISCYEAVEYLKDIGVDVIITDHHEIPDKVPNCICIDCKFTDQDYAYHNLSGSGVAYKVGRALIGEEADKYLGLVALATITDSMTLDGENRALVYEGINNIKKGETCKAVKALVDACPQKIVTSTNIAFSIGPKINAAGRMNNANLALKLFMSNDDKEIEELRTKISEYNIERQKECEKLYREVKKELVNVDVLKTIVAYGQDWQTGLVGIVSARIAEEYNVPVILFAGDGDEVHGSARSVDGINVFELIAYCKEYVVGFGGHSQAAGLTIKKENLEAFKNKFNEASNVLYPNFEYAKKTEVEYIVSDKMAFRFVRELDLFEPFGTGNKKPQFGYICQTVDAKLMKKDANHVVFMTGGLDCIYFNGIGKLDFIKSDVTKTLVFEPSINLYNGREYIRALVKDVEATYFPEVIKDNTGHYTFGQTTYMACLYSNLKSLVYKEYEGYKLVTQSTIDEDLKTSGNYGTLYILSNPYNINKFDLSKHTVNFLNIVNNGGRSVVVVGGIPEKGDLSLYNRYVYLDTPLLVDKFPTVEEVVVNDDVRSFDLNKINPSRDEFVNVYKQIVRIIKSRDVHNIFNIFYELGGVREEEFVFAFSVFEELGFIKYDEKYYIDSQVHSDLGNSKIYNAILKIKG